MTNKYPLKFKIVGEYFIQTEIVVGEFTLQNN